MKTSLKLLSLVFLLALFLRLFKLSEFPFGFHADEVRVGWNALSILETGRDDRGNKFALYYNTFGDFRPTGIFYLTIPSLALFGRNEFAVRFPSALLGALTIFPLFFFVKRITNKKADRIGLLASFLLAINPWHISTSRATSEVVISLFFTLWGLYFFVSAIQKKGLKYWLLSFLFLVISFFFYHSVRLLAPLFLLALIFYFFKNIKRLEIFKPALLTLGALSLVTLLLVSNKEAKGRFSQVSIFSDLDVKYELSRMPFEEGPNKVFVARLFHNKPSVYIRRLVNEYTKYFSSSFFLEPTVPKPARYQTVGVGLLTYAEFLLLILGTIAIAQKRTSYLPLLLLIISPFAAALTTEDAPNLHRSLYMVIFLATVEAYGFIFLVEKLKKYKFTEKVLYLILFSNLVFFLHMYFVHSKVHLPLYRNVGAKGLALSLNKLQNDYDKIILTNIPDDPYPWIAFFTGRDPEVFNKDAILREKGTWTSENFVFTGLRCPSRDAFERPDVKKLLVVDAEGCATESNLVGRPDIRIIERVLRPDESEVYILWSRIEE